MNGLRELENPPQLETASHHHHRLGRTTFLTWAIGAVRTKLGCLLLLWKLTPDLGLRHGAQVYESASTCRPAVMDGCLTCSSSAPLSPYQTSHPFPGNLELGQGRRPAAPAAHSSTAANRRHASRDELLPSPRSSCNIFVRNL